MNTIRVVEFYPVVMPEDWPKNKGLTNLKVNKHYITNKGDLLYIDKFINEEKLLKKLKLTLKKELSLDTQEKIWNKFGRSNYYLYTTIEEFNQNVKIFDNNDSYCLVTNTDVTSSDGEDIYDLFFIEKDLLSEYL